MNVEALRMWSRSVETELRCNILPWWLSFIDKEGGWPGFISNSGGLEESKRGIVMHSRFLWTYAQAWARYKDETYRSAALHALEFMENTLRDTRHGGYHWMVEKHGVTWKPSVEHKVIYGQAFAIYGMATWAKVSGDANVLKSALDLFDQIEDSAKDKIYGGYYEAVSTNWANVVPNALGNTDITCEKSMNTNLHVLEAYTALYLASGDSRVEQAIKDLIEVHSTKIRTSPGHFSLYFNREWTAEGTAVSFGHDIEGSWLIYEAAEVVYLKDIPKHIIQCVLDMASACLKIVQKYGPGLVNEEEHGVIDTRLIWWVQAEALVGFVNAWELGAGEEYLESAMHLWDNTMRLIKDHHQGEWFWGRNADGLILEQPKGGVWKTSYHNGRACMELLNRLHHKIDKAKD